MGIEQSPSRQKPKAQVAMSCFQVMAYSVLHIWHAEIHAETN
jgi:hypothetical protein